MPVLPGVGGGADADARVAGTEAGAGTEARVPSGIARCSRVAIACRGEGGQRHKDKALSASPPCLLRHMHVGGRAARERERCRRSLRDSQVYPLYRIDRAGRQGRESFALAVQVLMGC